MKNIYLILALVISLNFYAQDPQLFENTWFLHALTISDIEYIPPYTEPIVEETNFDEDPPLLSTGYCDFFGMDIIYDSTTNLFDVLSLTTFGPGCLLIENINFNEKYYNFFTNNGELNNPFLYEITASGGSISLLIINANGDSALYGDEKLSNKDIDNRKFAIYPNPAKNELILTLKNTTGNLKIKIFNIEGKLLSTQNTVLENQISIDVSQLSSGIYFLNIEDENGNTAMKKFIKQ